jgi:hypothetical protein
MGVGTRLRNQQPTTTLPYKGGVTQQTFKQGFVMSISLLTQLIDIFDLYASLSQPTKHH